MRLDKAPRDMPVWTATLTVSGHSWIEVRYCFKALVVEEFYRLCLDKAPRDMPVWIPTMTVTGHSWIEVGLYS